MAYQWGQGPFECGTIVMIRKDDQDKSFHMGEIVGLERMRQQVVTNSTWMELRKTFVVKVVGHLPPPGTLGWVVERQNIKRFNDHEGDGYGGRLEQ